MVPPDCLPILADAVEVLRDPPRGFVLFLRYGLLAIILFVFKRNRTRILAVLVLFAAAVWFENTDPVRGAQMRARIAAREEARHAKKMASLRDQAQQEYESLQEARRHLDMSDAEAVARYNRDAARYSDLLARIKADRD